MKEEIIQLNKTKFRKAVERLNRNTEGVVVYLDVFHLLDQATIKEEPKYIKVGGKRIKIGPGAVPIVPGTGGTPQEQIEALKKLSELMQEETTKEDRCSCGKINCPIRMTHDFQPTKEECKHSCHNINAQDMCTLCYGNKCKVIKAPLPEHQHEFVPHYVQSLYLPQIDTIVICKTCGVYPDYLKEKDKT